MSKILKYTNVSLLHDDEYIVSRETWQKQHMPGSSNRGSDQEINAIQEAALAEAEDLLASSKVKAQKIVEEAHRQASSIKDEAYETGYSDGKAQGYSEGYDRATMEADQILKNELAKLDKLRKEIFKEKQDMLKQSEHELVMLALEVAQKIIAKELEDEDVYSNFIIENLKDVKQTHHVKIHVNEDGYDKVAKNKDYILSQVEGLDDFEIVCDKYLSWGSCIVDGGIGVIDGSVETQLRQIEKALQSIFDSE